METFSALLALCAGNSPVPGGFPSQRPVARSFEVFFDLRLNKRLSKQSWGWWFETTPHPLRRHSNEVLTCLFGAKSLADPKRAYCKLYPRGKVLKCRETSKMQKMFFFYRPFLFKPIEGLINTQSMPYFQFMGLLLLVYSNGILAIRLAIQSDLISTFYITMTS